MKSLRLPSLALLFAPLFAGSLLAQEAAAPAPKLGSTFFPWESLQAKPTGVGERRDVARNPTATLVEFECHISTLNPDKVSHPPHTHPQEELIVLREGTLDVYSNGTLTRVGPGSLFFFAANNPHAVQNHGDKPATYFVFNFATATTATLRGKPAAPTPEGHLGSAIFDWEKLVPKANDAGERRPVVDLPTATLAGLECHVTTLRAGATPGTPHRHTEELIVLVKEGQVEVALDDQVKRVGPGSICFVASQAKLGVKNTGDTPATYYIIKLKTEATPAKLALD